MKTSAGRSLNQGHQDIDCKQGIVVQIQEQVWVEKRKVTEEATPADEEAAATFQAQLE